MRTRLAWLFPRASERRVFLKWRSAIHPYIFILTSSHAHIFTSSHPHLLTSSISFFSSSHLHLFISSHHRQNLNLHVLTSPRHILKSSYHNIFFSSHPHLFTSSISFFSSYIFISSYLHTLYIIFYIFFFLRYLDIFLSLCFMLYHLLTYIFHYISLRSRAIRRLVFFCVCVCSTKMYIFAMTNRFPWTPARREHHHRDKKSALHPFQKTNNCHTFSILQSGFVSLKTVILRKFGFSMPPYLIIYFFGSKTLETILIATAVVRQCSRTHYQMFRNHSRNTTSSSSCGYQM